MLATHLLRRCTLGTLLCGFVLASSLHAAPIPAERVVGAEGKKYTEVDEAVTKFGAGNVEEARTLLQTAVSRHPELPPVGVMMGRLYFAANQEAAGRLELERTILQQPDDPEPFEMLGNLAIAQRRVTEADLLYKKVEELIGQMQGESSRKRNLTVRMLAGKSTVAEARGQWDEAKQHLEKWIAAAAKDPRPYMRLGQAHFQMNDPDGAFASFAKATELNPELQVPEIMLGRLYEQSGQTEPAQQWMDRAIERHPQAANAQVGVAEWHLRNERLAEAKQHAEQALQIKSNLPEGQLIRGLIARHERDFAEAEKHFEAAHAASPANFAASNQLALVLSEQRDPEKLSRAMQLTQANAKQFPQEPEVLATFGAVLMRSGRTEEAERILRQLAGTNAMSSDAAYYLGQILAKKNQTDEAKRLLRMALSASGPFLYRADAQNLLDQLSKR